MARLSEVNVWYDDEGSGFPLVLLGGFGGGHFIWDFVWPELSRFRRITWDPRGLGFSDAPEGVYSVEIWSRDLRELLDHLEIPKAHVWATGFGNYYAVDFVANNPDRVACFIAYTDVWAGDPAKEYGKIWQVYGPIVETFGVTERGLDLLMHMLPFPELPWFDEWERQNFVDTLRPERHAQTAGYCLTRADVRGALAEIQAPTMVLQGGNTWSGGTVEEAEDESVRLMRQAIPDLEVVTIPGTHPTYVLVERPRECVAAIETFIDRHSHSATGQ